MRAVVLVVGLEDGEGLGAGDAGVVRALGSLDGSASLLHRATRALGVFALGVG